ncbi:hypothetical protein ABW20_dc0107718 [Dactylellina cionopaga]|nr:hypothetical protein ABW20_dc0107718 [Dactylellina cionopaga]
MQNKVIYKARGIQQERSMAAAAAVKDDNLEKEEGKEKEWLLAHGRQTNRQIDNQSDSKAKAWYCIALQYNIGLSSQDRQAKLYDDAGVW